MTSNDNTNRKSGRASARVQNRAAAGPEIKPPRAERRPEMIRQRREQRGAEYARDQRNWTLTKIGLIGFGVVAVAVVAFFVYQFIQEQQPVVIPEGVADFAYTGNIHVSGPVEYAETPPVGGEHDAIWQNCGYYSAPVRSENAVHSLEHGAVWITYEPGLPEDQVELLRNAAGEPYMLVSPFEGLPSPVVASSWNHQLQLDSANDERLDQFIRAFRQGPDTPEPGASCFGGVGTPE
ncbi:MAG: DUF3105 domain-containing protein [Chloroflexota bacterium]|nr:DUF3105 domain-containing protein [Chloroflexota bacterium]